MNNRLFRKNNSIFSIDLLRIKYALLDGIRTYGQFYDLQTVAAKILPDTHVFLLKQKLDNMAVKTLEGFVLKKLKTLAVK